MPTSLGCMGAQWRAKINSVFKYRYVHMFHVVCRMRYEMNYLKQNITSLIYSFKYHSTLTEIECKIHYSFCILVVFENYSYKGPYGTCQRVRWFYLHAVGHPWSNISKLINLCLFVISIHVTSFDIPSASITTETKVGLKVSASGLSMSIHGDWRYKLDSL